LETAYYPTVLTSRPHPAERDVGTRETSARGDPAPATRGGQVTESPTTPQAPPPKTTGETSAPTRAPVSPEQPPTEVEFVQLLTPEGERVEHPDYAFDLDDEAIRGFYRDMVLVRRIDTEATALQRQGELGIWASLLGQEAAQIGSGRALNKRDMVFPTYSEHGVAWGQGVDPLNLLGLFRGVDQGAWDPRDNNFHLYTIVIGAQTLHATGSAMGQQRDHAVGDADNGEATIAYFGDGASSQGDVNEAFIYASV